MRTLHLLGSGQVKIAEAQTPPLSQGEVLLRIELSALCGSELGAFRAQHPFNGNPGHEAVGVVVDANGSEHFHDGDRVGVYPPHGCGACSWCLSGMDTFCADRGSVNNLHAELVAVPERALLRIPDDVPFDAAVLLVGDGLGVPFHVNRRLNLQPGRRVCVFGCGPIGLGHIQLLGCNGHETVGVDFSHTRLELARALGAIHVVDAAGNAGPDLLDLTDGHGFDAVVIATGSSAAFAAGLRCLANGGTMVLVGGVRDVTFDPTQELLLVDKSIIGSFFYPRREFPDMLELVRSGYPVTDLITHRFPLEQAQIAYDLFASGETGKVLLTR